MKPRINRFRAQSASATPEGIAAYLANDLARSLSDFEKSFSSLSIDDNFNGFVARDVELLAFDLVKIPNRLGKIPRSRIVLRSDSPLLCDGEWTTETLEITNTCGISMADSVTGIVSVPNQWIQTDFPHGFAENMKVLFNSASAPGGLVDGQTYYVGVITPNTFRLYRNPSRGGQVTLTTTGGVFTLKSIATVSVAYLL